MQTLLEQYVLLFFISSILGWLMEVCCKLVQFHRFINRGFLIGPYCPIYGFGAELVTALLSPFAEAPVAVFVMAVAVCGTLEYLTSYLMEKLFHARWWDYSHKRFNLNGRICADTLIPFGLLGLLMIYVVKPFLFGQMEKMPPALIEGLCMGLICLFVADAVLSVTVLNKIRKEADLSGEDDTENITRAVREHLAKQSALVRRALVAFPYARLYSKSLMQKLRQRRKEIRLEMKEKMKRLADKIGE